MFDEYRVDLCGLERRYPVVALSEGVRGVYFFMPGDVELIEHCGRLIADRIGKDCDYLMVPEAGGIPLAHAIARRLGLDYLVVRKSVRCYMDSPIVEEVKSITGPGAQKLVIDGRDIEKIRGKRVALVDDVLSTLGTLRGLFRLAERCSSEVTHVAAVFLEGETSCEQIRGEFGCSLTWLGHLPLFASVEGMPNAEI